MLASRQTEKGTGQSPYPFLVDAVILRNGWESKNLRLFFSSPSTTAGCPGAGPALVEGSRFWNLGKQQPQFSGSTTNADSNTGTRSHTGPANSGIGRAWNSFLHCFAVHYAHRLDFLRRALSVEIPVPAYICRYNFDRKMNPSRARRVGVQAERSQIAPQV